MYNVEENLNLASEMNNVYLIYDNLNLFKKIKDNIPLDIIFLNENVIQFESLASKNDIIFNLNQIININDLYGDFTESEIITIKQFINLIK
tara:strand:- start:2558 stop:2830 length:273 start_codon:yes stop_codon:yes gene_type:complete